MPSNELVTYSVAGSAAIISYLIYQNWPRLPKGLEHLSRVPVGKAFGALFNMTKPFDEKYWAARKDLPHDGRRMYLLQLGFFNAVDVAAPELAKQVLDQSNFEKILAFNNFLGLPSFFQYLFGTNIVGSNDPEWSRHRVVVRGAFSRPLRTPPFIVSASKLIRALHLLPNQKSVDVYSWMQRLTLDVLGRVIFSFDFESLNDPEDPGKYVSSYNEMMKRIINPINTLFSILSYLPTKFNKDTWKLCKEFKNLLIKMIQDRLDLRKNGEVKKMDLLDMMISASDESGKDFSMDDVVHNLGVFFVAGHDTTANVLAAVSFLLAKHPEIQEKTREEVYSVLGKPTSREEAITAGPEHTQLGRLPYLNAVLKEAIRLYPSATNTGFRRAVKDVTVKYRDINGVERVEMIPKGSVALVDIFGMQHDPEYFPDPQEFRPDRWLTEKDGEGAKPWMPFGGGQRICLGMQFSLVEQRVTVAMLLRNFELGLTTETQELKLAPTGLMKPEGLRISLRPLI